MPPITAHQAFAIHHSPFAAFRLFAIRYSPFTSLARSEQSDFPGETLRGRKEKELRQYGRYCTCRLVQEAR